MTQASSDLNERTNNLEIMMKQIMRRLDNMSDVIRSSQTAVPPPTAPPTTAPANPFSAMHQYPRAPKVPQFNGNESKLESWLSQTESILMITPGISLSDVSCVNYACLFLEDKARLAWDHRARELEDKAAGCHNWHAFSTLLRKLLGATNTDITGRARLRDLRQTGSVQTYAETFLRYARSLETPMPDLELREQFIHGLKRDVQQYIRQQHPDSFHDAQTAATLYDKTFYGLFKKTSSSSSAVPMELGSVSTSRRHVRIDSRSPSPGPSNRRSYTPRASNHRSHSPAPARLNALTAEERQRCIDENLCFRCRQPGHRTSSCPKNRDTERGRSPARKN